MKTAAAAGIVFHPDCTPMSLDNGSANRQSESDSLARDFLALFDLMELLEDFFFVEIPNSGARIGDGYQTEISSLRSVADQTAPAFRNALRDFMNRSGTHAHA